MTTTYIFYSCDEHKSHISRQAKFTFTDSNFKKVLKFIEVNMVDYFDGSPTRQRDQFNALHSMVKDEEVSISNAINRSEIYASCEEIQPIQNIQY